MVSKNSQCTAKEGGIKWLAASQFAYLYYALKVCTLFVKKKYILLSMYQNSRQALGHTTVSLTDALLLSYASCNCLNCPVNHLVTVNIIHISFNLISYRIGEK